MIIIAIVVVVLIVVSILVVLIGIVEVIVLCIGYSAFTVAIPSYCPNLYCPQCIYSGDPILLSQFVLATVHLHPAA